MEYEVFDACQGLFLRRGFSLNFINVQIIRVKKKPNNFTKGYFIESPTQHAPLIL
jgi:hypothetical protein